LQISKEVLEDYIGKPVEFKTEKYILKILCIQCKNKVCKRIFLKQYIEKRAMDIGIYIVDKSATVRQAAGAFGVSKSTVHKDVAERLPQIDMQLAKEARAVLDVNKAERHIRGGMATKEKYAHNH
jgi:putative DeoR family transcriptional regulator (stage III sporulation protein D)